MKVFATIVKKVEKRKRFSASDARKFAYSLFSEWCNPAQET